MPARYFNTIEVVKVHEPKISTAMNAAHHAAMDGTTPPNDNSAEAVAMRIRALRAALNLKPSEAAKMLGVSQSTWANWEGTPKNPPIRVGLEMALRIRRTFSVTLDYLYCGDMGGLSVRMAERLAGQKHN